MRRSRFLQDTLRLVKIAESNQVGFQFEGSTTNPAAHGSPDANAFTYHRVGDSMEYEGTYNQSTKAPGPPGAGTLLIRIPDNLTIDTAKQPTNTSVDLTKGDAFCGTVHMHFNALLPQYGWVWAFDSTRLAMRVLAFNLEGFVLTAALTNSEKNFSLRVFGRIPILEWKHRKRG